MEQSQGTPSDFPHVVDILPLSAGAVGAVPPAPLGVTLMNRQWPSVLGASMHNLREKQLYCDISIMGGEVGDSGGEEGEGEGGGGGGGGEPIRAHSVVLSAASPILSMLVMQISKDQILQIPGISSWMWNVILQFVYTGHVIIAGENKHKLPELENVAKQLQLTHLCMEIQKAVYEKTFLLQSATSHEVDTGGLHLSVDHLPQHHYQQHEEQVCLLHQQQHQHHVLHVHPSNLIDPSLQIQHHQQQQQQQQQLHEMHEYEAYGDSLQQQQVLQEQVLEQDLQFELAEDLHQHEQQTQQLAQQQQQQHDPQQQLMPQQLPQQQEQQHLECPQMLAHFARTNTDLMHAPELHLTTSEACVELEAYKSESDEANVDPDYFPESDIHESEDQEEVEEMEVSVEEENEVIKISKWTNVAKSNTKFQQKASMKGAASSMVMCTECNKNITSGYLRKHYLKRHKELCRLYTCTFCSWETREKFEYFNHVRTHTGGKPHVCMDCRKPFLRLELLRDHVMQAHTHERHVCGNCAKTFASVAGLRAHRYSVHPPAAEHPCVRPRRRPSSKRRPKACTYCGHTFLMASDLKAHEMAHRGEKPFACSECELCFTTASHRRKHEAVHRNEKPHMCSYCGFSSNRKANLRNHERIHTGDLPYACDQCDGKARFRVKTQLKVHKLKAHSVDLSREEANAFGGTDLRRKNVGGGAGREKNIAISKSATKRQTVKDAAATMLPTTTMVKVLVMEQPQQQQHSPASVLSACLQTSMAVPNNTLHRSAAIASNVLSFAESVHDIHQDLVGVGSSMHQIMGAPTSSITSSIGVSLAGPSGSYCIQTTDGMVDSLQTTNLENSSENWMNLFAP